MGKQQTKINGWRLGVLGLLAVFSCIVMSVGYCFLGLSNLSSKSLKLNAAEQTLDNTEEESPYGGVYWSELESSMDSPIGGKEYYIDSPGQLARMINMFAETDTTAADYTGYTFVLGNDIILDSLKSDSQGGETVYPLWTPIEIGKNGKNRNFTFDGRGHSIIGMKIEYDIKPGDVAPRNVGLFTELYGGVFENVTFKNPVIEYNYLGKSFADDNEDRPDGPVEISVGVVAGSSDSTYINNVTIENPTVKVTTENTNGHNFYVGAAVGKISFTNELVKNVRKSINTVTPSQWGLNTVNVLTNDNSTTETGVTLQINAGTAEGVTYGQATKGYLGGLVGVNVSSKIINSTLRDFPITPDFNPKEGDATIGGIYHVGGLAGLSTQITSAKELLVAAGLYNNLLIDVNLGDASALVDEGNYYGGNLVGRVYSGGWIYNNMVIGSMLYDDFWGQVFNSQIYLVSSADCIANVVGGVDEYYLSGDNQLYPNCSYGVVNPGSEKFLYCTKHNSEMINLVFDGTQVDDSPKAEKMKDYNLYFSSTSSVKFNDFCKGSVTVEEEDGSNLPLSNFGLMNYFKQSAGFMYHAVQPILKYEVGLTVNGINPDTGNEATDYEMRVDAIHQFRTWKYDQTTNEPTLSDYTGLDYTVTFVANSPSDSTAYWTKVDDYGYEKEIPELESGRTYQTIYPVEDPICEGYKFVGWKVEGLENGTSEWNVFLARGLINEDGMYQFGKEQITEPGRRFLAVWERKSYTVKFIVREKGSEDVEFYTEVVFYGKTIKGPQDTPTSEKGNSFVGWYLEENLPVKDEEDANPDKQWIMGGNSDDLMPGRDITLYTGWINNFTVLSNLLDNEDYKTYHEKYDLYFTDETGIAFYEAYEDASEARKNGNTRYTEILLDKLSNAFAGLQIDPEKMLESSAFDESRIENSCPFLYDYEVRMSYVTFKKSVSDYVKSDAFDNLAIKANIENYNHLMGLFNDLEKHPSESVDRLGGINSSSVQNLINEYFRLQNENAELNTDLYSSDSLADLDEAKAKAEELWTKQTGANFADVKFYVNAFKDALASLKPAGAENEESGDINKDEESTINSVPQLPIQPVLLGVIVVSILAAGTCGYIGFDIIYGKRRMARKAESERIEKILEDDDSYF